MDWLTPNRSANRAWVPRTTREVPLISDPEDGGDITESDLRVVGNAEQRLAVIAEEAPTCPWVKRVHSSTNDTNESIEISCYFKDTRVKLNSD